MKKRSFPRYDTHIDARYCSDKKNGAWNPCTVTKLSRKGMGVAFPAGDAPPTGALLRFRLSTGKESDAINLQGIVKWVERGDAGCAGGIELSEIVDELLWLQLIYCIHQPSEKKRVVDIKTITEHVAVKKGVPTPPPKVTVPTTLDNIKTILNYKIL